MPGDARPQRRRPFPVQSRDADATRVASKQHGVADVLFS